MTSSLFAVASNQESDYVIRRIPTDRGLQDEIEDLFKHQAEQYTGDVALINYNPRDRLDSGEVFVIRKFDLPEVFDRCIKQPQEFEDIDANQNLGIKALLLAVTKSEGEDAKLLFQAFSIGRQSLGKRFTIFFSRNVFQKLETPGLMLNDKIDAAFISGNLLFRNFSNTNRFIDLTVFFNAATDKDIKEILGHKLFSVESTKEVIDCADSMIRKKIMIIKKDKSLDEIDPRDVKRIAKKYGIDVSVKNGKIAFPSTRKQVKDLLRVLMDAYYEGEVTGRKYIATAQRLVD